MVGDLDKLAVDNFREYLRIPSVHPNIDYDDCVLFLKKQASTIGLGFKVYEVVAKKPIVVLTLVGTEPTLPTILLNSHMDVVPVFPEFWKYGPFDADLDENGNIYARGSQDMKSVGIQYLEAVRRLKLAGKQFKRTIHLSYVPDEEIGGIDGMKKFVHTDQFKELNVGFVLDEGYSSPTSSILVFNGERNIWQIQFKCSGPGGHGSLLMENTAGEKLSKLTSKIMSFREGQLKKLNSNPDLTMGDVTTVNLTMLKGGVEPNVIPPELCATFDFRLSLDVDEVAFENQINQWIKESGGDIEINWIQKGPQIPPTKIDSSNIFWNAIKQEFEKMNIAYKVATFPGGTDGRYCRQVGLPVIGFSPIINTPILLHAHDEFLNKDIFLEGIKVYENVIPAVAEV